MAFINLEIFGLLSRVINECLVFLNNFSDRFEYGY
jgi:hypothetical protein